MLKCFVQFKVKRSLAQRAVDQKRWMKVMMKEGRQEKAAGEEEVRICNLCTHIFKCALVQITENVSHPLMQSSKAFFHAVVQYAVLVVLVNGWIYIGIICVYLVSSLISKSFLMSQHSVPHNYKAEVVLTHQLSSTLLLTGFHKHNTALI